MVRYLQIQIVTKAENSFKLRDVRVLKAAKHSSLPNACLEIALRVLFKHAMLSPHLCKTNMIGSGRFVFLNDIKMTLRWASTPDLVQAFRAISRH